MVVDEVVQAVKELAALDLDTLTDGELADAMVDLARARSMLEAQHANIGRRWEASCVWANDGARSPTMWLATRTRLPKQECASLLWAARRAQATAHIAPAWQAGEISAAHVRRLTGVCNRRTAPDFARDEAMLVELARTLPFAEFCQALDYWLLHADPDGADSNDLDRRDRRRVSLDETISGMFSGSILLDPVSGLAVSNELRRLEQRLFDDDWAEAKQRLGREPQAFELRRTPDQRRADALVAMAKRSAAAPPGASAKPLFTLILGSEHFARLCELENGTVVAPAALRDWATDANLETIVFDGTGERAIRVSRQRDFTGAVRRVIEVRDRRCYHPYCDTPARLCQADHIIPWSANGPTSQDNGRLACGHHNRLRNKRPPPPP